MANKKTNGITKAYAGLRDAVQDYTQIAEQRMASLQEQLTAERAFSTRFAEGAREAALANYRTISGDRKLISQLAGYGRDQNGKATALYDRLQAMNVASGLLEDMYTRAKKEGMDGILAERLRRLREVAQVTEAAQSLGADVRNAYDSNQELRQENGEVNARLAVAIQNTAAAYDAFRELRDGQSSTPASQGPRPATVVRDLTSDLLPGYAEHGTVSRSRYDRLDKSIAALEAELQGRLENALENIMYAHDLAGQRGRRLTAAEAQNSKLAAQLEAAEGLIAHYADDESPVVQRLARALQSARQERRDVSRVARELGGDLRQAYNQNAALQGELDGQDAVVRGLVERVQRADVYNDRLMGTIDQFDAQIAEGGRLMAGLESELSSARNRAVQAEQRANRLARDYDRLDDDVEELNEIANHISVGDSTTVTPVPEVTLIFPLQEPSLEQNSGNGHGNVSLAIAEMEEEFCNEYGAYPK